MYATSTFTEGLDTVMNILSDGIFRQTINDEIVRKTAVFYATSPWQVYLDKSMICTAKNATDLLQVVELQLVNMLERTCQLHQVATSLQQLVICRLVKTCRNNLQQACG